MRFRQGVLAVLASVMFVVGLALPAQAYATGTTQTECTSGRTYYHTTGWGGVYYGSDGYPRVEITSVEIRPSGGAVRTDYRILIQTKSGVAADWVTFRDYNGTDSDGTVYILAANPRLMEDVRVQYHTSRDGDGLGACVRTHNMP